MTEWKAQAKLSHGKTKQILWIEWKGNLKEGDFVTLEDIHYEYLNGPKRLWRIEKITEKERIPQFFVTYD